MGWGDKQWGEMIWGAAPLEVPMASDLVIGAIVLALLLIGRQFIVRRAARMGVKR